MAKTSGDIRITPEASVELGVGTGAIPDYEREEVKKAVVYIHRKDKEGKQHKGSGFIAKLAVDGQDKVLLMTCHHVLPSLSEAQESDIYFGRTSDDDDNSTQYTGTIIKGDELFDSSYFKTDTVEVDGWGKRFDYTAVEVKKEVLQKRLLDEAPKPLSLTMAELIENRKEGLRVNDLLYIVHYPKEQNYVRCTNSEVLRVLKGPYMGHVATTDTGSSGSPILREYHNKWVVVGLHRGSKFGSVNIATLITSIVDDIQGVAYSGKVPDLGCFLEAAKQSAKEQTNTPQGSGPFVSASKSSPILSASKSSPLVSASKSSPLVSTSKPKDRAVVSSTASRRLSNMAVGPCTELKNPIKYVWKDQQMALFGSDMEWLVKLSNEAAKGEPAWKGFGRKAGIHIWRYAKYKLSEWPKMDYGTFFSHDTYIILNTHRKHTSDEMLHDVHLWVGTYTAKDDYKGVAYLIVELATCLDDEPVQHREVMGHESDLFKSYFESIVYLEGGAHMGYHHVKGTEHIPRLLLFHGQKNVCTAREVPRNVHSLNSAHVFILDLGVKFYVWCGKELSDPGVAMEALQFVQKLKSVRAVSTLGMSGKLKMLWNEELSEKFMHNLSHDVLDEKEEEDTYDSDFIPCAMRLSNQSGIMTTSLTHEGQLPLPRSCCNSWSVSIFDTGKCLYVWTSRGASSNETKNGLSYAHNYLKQTMHPLIPVSCYVQGREPDEFWKVISQES